MAPTTFTLLGWTADGAQVVEQDGITWMLTRCCKAAVTGSFVGERAASVCKGCYCEVSEDTTVALEASVWDQPGVLESEPETPASFFRHRDGLVGFRLA